jgi:hypothetical protein
VPTSLRRAVFNYVPMSSPVSELAPDLHGTRLSPGFPIWRRPWELHLTVVDLRSATHLAFTCGTRLFSAETTQRFFDRFLANLERDILESDAH